MDKKNILERAKELSDSGREEDARILLIEYIKESPEDIAGLLMLGGSYYTEKLYSEATVVFKRLVQLAPGVGKVSTALFNTLWQQEMHEEALQEIQRFISVADKEKERATLKEYVAVARRMMARSN